MKTLKITTFITVLVFFLLSCNGKRQQQTNKTLEKEQNTITEKIKTQNKNFEDWKKRVKILQQMKEGEELDVTSIPAFQNHTAPQFDLWEEPKLYNEKHKEPTPEEFEDSNHWRREAYKATNKCVQNAINKEPNCRAIRQGNYRSYLVRYLGNFGFLVKTYCEFDCKHGYNNPSYFWVEAYYQGSNRWNCEIVKQKLVD